MIVSRSTKLLEGVGKALTQTRQISNRQTIILRQLFEPLSYTYTYILGCPKTKEAVIIDPVLETVDRDIAILNRMGLKLVYATNTHCHADHVTGTGLLREKYPSEVKTIISETAAAQADILLKIGDEIKWGEDEKLEIRSTPGHTDGCTSFVHHGAGMVFTGDSLLINGCGRTDFQQGSPIKLYDSVHREIFSLPDDFIVYPAHDYKGIMSSTVGEEKNSNSRLTKTKEEFIDIMKHLNLPYPAQIEKSLPANKVCGVFDRMDEKLRQKVIDDFKKYSTPLL